MKAAHSFFTNAIAKRATENLRESVNLEGETGEAIKRQGMPQWSYLKQEYRQFKFLVSLLPDFT